MEPIFIKVRLELEREDLTPELEKKAKDELRETPERRKKALEKFRELIDNDSAIKVPTYDDFLIKFLRPTKYYPESALQLLKRALEFKRNYSSLFSDLLPQSEEEAIKKTSAINVISNRDDKGRRVLLLYAGGKWDPSEVNTDQILRIFYLIHQCAMLEPATQVSGVVVIMDFLGLSLKQVAAFSPTFAYKLLLFCQDAMPLRLKEIHIINQPFIFNMTYQIFKPFLKEKLKSRIFLHGYKLSSLHQFIDPSHLPSDFDGDLPRISYQAKDWWPALVETEPYMKEWNKCEIVKKH